MKYSFLLAITFIFYNLALAQVKLNSSGGTPDASSIIEMTSTTKGILIPRMTSTNRLNIVSPADGLLVYQNNGLKGFYFYNGIAWDTLGGASNITNISNVTNVSNSGIVVLRDVKAVNTDGGDFDKDTWFTRDLNEYKGDSSFISLTDNVFTLDSGVYVVTASAPAFNVDEHQIRLLSQSNGVVGVGTVQLAEDNVTSSTLNVVIRVNSTKESFTIQHIGDKDKNNDGFGKGSKWVESIFTVVQIEEL